MTPVPFASSIVKPASGKFAAAALLAILTVAADRASSQTPTTAPAPTTSRSAVDSRVSVESHFSPEEEIAKTVVKMIDGAQRSIDVAAFTFSHPDISNALIRAHQRDVRVHFLMDYTQSRLTTCRAPDLINAGIEVRTRHRRGFQHNKYIVIDDAIVLTGSYNFTTAADNRNTENLLVIRNAPELVRSFLKDYEILRGYIG